MNRINLVPLRTAKEVYDVLVALNVGDVVPPEIYIRDYRNGDIPAWIIREREGDGQICTVLTLVDESIAGRHVGMEVITCPAKTLGGVLYRYFPGCIKARHSFGDIRQHARQIADRLLAGLSPYPGSRQPSDKDLQKLREWNQLSLNEEGDDE